MTDPPTDPDEVARLRQEVERLEGANASLKRRMSLRGGLRRGSRVGLLVLGCLLAFLAALTIWARFVLLDTDRYVDTVAPLATRPDVQDAISKRLGDRVVGSVDLQAYATELLPPRAEPLAAPIATGVESFIRGEVSDFVHSDRFERLWDGANRKAHALVIQLLTGEEVRNVRIEDDAVVLDLGGVVDGIRQRLTDRGMDRLAARIPAETGRDVPLVQSSAIGSAQTAVRALKGIAILLPILSLLSLAGYVLLSGDRRRAILRAALALTGTMVVLLGFVGIARSAYLDALSSGQLSGPAAGDVFDTLVRFLKDGVRITVAAAVVIAIVAALLGRPLDRLALSGAARRGREAAWVRDHRAALQIGVAALGAIVLLAWNTPGAGVVLVLFALVALAIGLIAALARAPAAPA
jgi:hypothetical protein